MERRLALALVLAVACGGSQVPARRDAPELARVDVFGSARLDRTTAIARWGDLLVRLVHAADAADQEGDEFGKLHDTLVAQIEKFGDFAFVGLSPVGYYQQGGGTLTYLTIDLVDRADQARRMSFLPEPTGEYPDPDGVIALWREYETAQRELSMQGAIDFKVPEKCPFWHCITFAHPSLAKYREAFAARVPPVEAELATILREDKREAHRGAAAYLLAHIASGERVAELMLPAIRDRSSLVRNDALRVLAVMARNHPEIAIPVEQLLVALEFPTTLDRNKASATLAAITARPLSNEQRDAIVRRSGEVLVDMLALRQPNNHDFAYQILKNLAGQDLGEHAVDRWRAWVRDRRSAR